MSEQPRPTWLSDGALIAGWEAKAESMSKATYHDQPDVFRAEGRITELRMCANELRSRLAHASEPDSPIEVTKREGVRFREHTMTVKTVWNDTGTVTQTLESELGVLQKRSLATMELQAREALIALGWTPPAKR